MNKLLLVVTVIVHYVVFLSFVMTAVMSVFVLKLYIAIALNALIFRVIFSSNECPLTTLENHYRTKLLMNKSRGFLKDYILFPKKTLAYLYTKLK